MTVVGVGEMGAPMARRLMAAGLTVTVCDRSEESLATFAADGARTSREPAACAGDDVVLVVVNTAAQVRDVLAGPDGLTSRMAAPGPVVLVMSTVAASVVREMDAYVRTAGGRLIDAPVSGGDTRAAAGSLTIMVGGRSEDVNIAAPVLSHLGSHVFHCGPVGAGENVKILNNAIGTLNALVTAEVARLAIGCGVDLDLLANVLEVSTGRNFLSTSGPVLRRHFERYGHSHDVFRSAKALYQKDAALAAELAASAKGQFPVIDAIVQLAGDNDDKVYETWRAIAHVDASGPSGGSPAVQT